MKRSALLLTVLISCSVAAIGGPPQRPRILGIAGVTILVSDTPESRGFYQKVTDPERVCNFCEEVPSRTFFLPSTQHITLDQLSAPPPSNLLAQVSFRTDDLQKLRKFLKANGIAFQERKTNGKSGALTSLLVHDPDGHNISFVEAPQLFASPLTSAGPNLAMHQSPSSIRIIHAGFVVKDLAAENRFYVELLGFRLYWHGGFKDEGEDWYELQVPDGTDWIEYMLNIPANADKKELGIQNHFSLGVKDIHAAEEQLRKNGITKFDGPEIGRDGKWSIDAYDPDGTRVEIMEFTPAKDPCCHPYTGPHPTP